ncbi:MAG: membrane protein insertion efficiency factor YidD [Sphingobacteriales bacterium]|nr:MAG: membrane protein insertion efficiency factor YidD [Sphingobacteriales bacterium]
MNKIIRAIFIFPIRLYQLFFSPFLGGSCRYTPSCSTYMLEAIEEWGVIKGVYLGIKRLSSCHPWGGHGYDPVPKKQISAKK